MSAALHLLFVASPSEATEALVAVRRGGDAFAHLVPSATALQQALSEPHGRAAWDAVVFIPGGLIEEAEVAAFVPDGVPLIVADAEVPPLLAETAALAVPRVHLHTLHDRLAVRDVAEPERPDAVVESAETAEPVDAVGVMDRLPIGLYRSDESGRILYANPALARLFGCDSVEELREVDVRTDLGYPRDQFAAEICRTGAVRNLIVTWVRPGGATVHTRENARSVTDAEGHLLYYEGTMEDVTAEVEAQREERAAADQHACVARFAAAAAEVTSSSDLYASAAETLLHLTHAVWAVVVVVTSEGNQCVAHAGAFSAATIDILNADAAFRTVPVASTTLHQPSLSDVSPEDLDPALVDLLVADGIGSFASVPIMRAGVPLGALLWGREAGAPYAACETRGAEALAWHLAGHLARARAMRDLWDSELSLGVIAAHSSNVLYRIRHTPEGGVFDYLSPSVEALTGMTPEEIEAEGGLSALILDREVYKGAGMVDGPVEGGGRYVAEYRMRTRQGERWVENRGEPWRAVSGAPIGLVGVLQDVTDRKHREDRRADAAQQALARQRALVDLARLGPADALGAPAAEMAAAALGVQTVSFWLCEESEDVCQPIHAPEMAAEVVLPCALLHRLAGHRALTVDDVHGDERVPAFGLTGIAEALGLRALLVAPVRRSGRAVGLVLVHYDEAREWTSSEVEFAAAVADALALALARRERMEAQAALEASERRYRALSELTSDYAFAVRVGPQGEGRIEWATDVFQRICGHDPTSLTGHGGFLAILHPDSRPAAARALARLAEGRPIEIEAQVVAPDGSMRWVSHRARVGEADDDGSLVVYHSGQDVTVRRQYEEDLRAARAQAEEMNHLKSAFLANMSHEIRTPLTGILGWAEMLGEEVSGEHTEFVDHIMLSALRLLDTLNDVLDLSRLEAGEMQPALDSLDLASVVETAARRFRADAEEKGIAFEIDVPPGLCAVADPAGFRKVVAHLVGNAVKFTPSGYVRVAADAEGDDVVLRVIDTGVGISEAFLPHLFDAFRQEDTGHTRRHEGSGLGLTLTRRLVELMGGRIEVASQRPGGSTFTVTFARGAEGHEAPPLCDPVSKASPSGDGQRVDFDELTLGLPPIPADTRPVSPCPGDATFHSIVTAPGLGLDSARPSTASPSAPAVPTSMFDFSFGRSSAPDPSPPTDAPEAPAPASAAPSQGPAPVATGTPPAPDEEPVMIVRSKIEPERTPLPAPAASQPAASEPTAAAATPPDAAQVVPEAEDDGQPSILVVEDNNDTRMLLERILRSTYDVTAVPDARSALLAMNARRFSGLVLDINLGGKETGADVLRIARSLPNYDGVFAIALTAYALPGDRERLLASGFNEYISKPFTRQSLMDTLAAGVLA